MKKSKYNFKGILFKHTDTEINIWEEHSNDESGLCRWMFNVADWLNTNFKELPLNEKIKVKISIEIE